MNRLVLIALSIGLLAAVAGAPAAARSQRQKPEQSWENLRTLRIFQKVRVQDQEMKSQDGKFLSVSEEAISFQVGQEEVTIERPDVLRVSTLRGAYPGAAVTVYQAERRRGRTVLYGGTWGTYRCCCSSETSRVARPIRGRRGIPRPQGSATPSEAAIPPTDTPVPNVADPPIAAEPSEPESFGDPPQTEPEVNEQAPDSAEPPQPEEQPDQAPAEPEVSQPEEGEPAAAEER